MNLRLEIRRILSEAFATPHFKERVFDRLESDSTTFRNEKPEIKKVVRDAIEFVEKVNFPGQDNIGILLMKSPNKYIYDRYAAGGKHEHSEGNFIWAVVRANDMETIIFNDFKYKPQNTQMQFTIDRLRSYIMDTKKGDFNLTDKDLKRLLAPAHKQGEVPTEPELPMINIGGVKYVVDTKNEKIYKKNNPAAIMNLYSFLDTVD